VTWKGASGQMPRFGWISSITGIRLISGKVRLLWLKANGYLPFA
jgi:hypothetical protein